MKHTVLVTGGAGYIGSHITYELIARGHDVIILDSLVYDQHNVVNNAPLIKGNCGDQQLLATIFSQHPITAVMHCAAFIEVGASTKQPLDFYDNNVSMTINLLASMRTHKITKLIFSSSCAVYGTPQFLPLTEMHPYGPISPYGATKMMVERILADADSAHGIKSVALRYFNAAGASPKLNLGERHTPETHIIPLLLRAATTQTPFTIFGTDYATPDGTCVRDYLHVRDIANAHAQALNYLDTEQLSTCLNLGTGQGVSVSQLIKMVEKITGMTIKKLHGTMRQGDPHTLVADPHRAHTMLNWLPQHSQLETIIKDAYEFYLNGCSSGHQPGILKQSNQRI